MSKNALYIVIAVLLTVILAGGYYIYVSDRQKGDITMESGAIENKIASDPFADHPQYVTPELTKPYSNAKYKFSLKMPGDFSSRELAVDGTDTVIFENKNSEGVQVVISPYDDKSAKALTPEMIQRDIPDMEMRDVQVIEIGKEHRGVAFKSDNESFGGKSREVWFIFKGNLYQISTYERFDALLQKMFGTWEFK